MTSIVKELSIWINNNIQILLEKGIKVIDRIPASGSDHPWKASVGLMYDGIIVSYTVWERAGLQTELLVMDESTKNTIVMDEKRPEFSEIIHADLDGVVSNLLEKMYKNAG